MNFSDRRREPAVLLTIGMMCLAFALALPRFVHPTAQFGPDLMDGVRGFVFGVSIGMNLWSVILAKREKEN